MRCTYRVESSAARAGAPCLAEGIVEELDDGWGYWELDLDALFARAVDLPLYEDVITFLGAEQDLAFVVDEGVTAGESAAAARRPRRAARAASLRRLSRPRSPGAAQTSKGRSSRSSGPAASLAAATSSPAVTPSSTTKARSVTAGNVITSS